MSALQKFRKTFSFRKKKKRRDNTETSKPIQWQEDERKVREGTCSFQVKYLGCIEVFESRGMQVCEEAIKALKGSKNKQQRAVLYVSGEQLRVVDEISKGLIVDQTIEKVSFCAPDRSHDKGFAYICRDGASRRWMCHGFMSVKESVSGERLSHAVGCAFAVCLEKKQKREKEAVQVTFNEQGTSFTRMGSFRPATITERLQDPQSTIIAEPVPVASPQPGASGKGEVGAAIPRPRASANMIDRQGSLRLFPKLADASSPFKRDLSLRLNELPSTLQRQQNFGNGDNLEVSPVLEEEEEEEVASHELSSQLTSLSTKATPGDRFAAAVSSSPPPPVVPPRPSLTNGADAPAGAFSDAFGTPSRPSGSAFLFDPFVTAPAPFASNAAPFPNPAAPSAPAPAPPPAAAPAAHAPVTYHQQAASGAATNPFASPAGAAANPWASAPSPWAPTPAPRLLGVDRRDGSGDPFDVAWAERQASVRENSTNPFVSASSSSSTSGVVARGLPASAAAPGEKGFRVGV